MPEDFRIFLTGFAANFYAFKWERILPGALLYVDFRLQCIGCFNDDSNPSNSLHHSNLGHDAFETIKMSVELCFKTWIRDSALVLSTMKKETNLRVYQCIQFLLLNSSYTKTGEDNPFVWVLRFCT